jgi:hypothetical protein
MRMFSRSGRFRVLVALVFAPGLAPAALAQSAVPPAGMIAPSGNSDVFGPGGMLGSPGDSILRPGTAALPVMVPAGQVALSLSATFGKGLGRIGSGLDWRVYAAKPESGGRFKLVKEEKTPVPTLLLPAGNYIVHVDFGLATAVKPVSLRGTSVREEFELPAGGLRIEGRVGNARVPSNQISFDVFKGSQFEPGDRRPIAEHVQTGAVLVVPEGTYYIVSNYGDANAVVRSDIRVQAGKLTDITVNHRAAAITLKLVAEKGGEALANTAWSVLTPGGDVIKEALGAFPRVILAEGEYRAIARNEGKVYEREFKVVPGVDGDVEVLAR